MIQLEPWRLGVPGGGYVLCDPAGVVHVEVHRSGEGLNRILQLMQIEASHGLSIELLRNQIVAAIEVDREGVFTLRSRLDPWGVVKLADEVMVVDPRLWFRGSNWQWQ